MLHFELRMARLADYTALYHRFSRAIVEGTLNPRAWQPLQYRDPRRPKGIAGKAHQGLYRVERGLLA